MRQSEAAHLESRYPGRLTFGCNWLCTGAAIPARFPVLAIKEPTTPPALRDCDGLDEKERKVSFSLTRWRLVLSLSEQNYQWLDNGTQTWCIPFLGWSFSYSSGEPTLVLVMEGRVDVLSNPALPLSPYNWRSDDRIRPWDEWWVSFSDAPSSTSRMSEDDENAEEPSWGEI